MKELKDKTVIYLKSNINLYTFSADIVLNGFVQTLCRSKTGNY